MQYESYVGIRMINKDGCEDHGNGAFCFDFDYKNIGINLPGAGFHYIPIYRKGDAPVDKHGRDCWCWDGNIERPTLTPSIRITIGKKKEAWHGFLKNGIFQSV